MPPEMIRSRRLKVLGASLQRLLRGSAHDLARHERLAGYALVITVALAISLYMSLALSQAQWSLYGDHELRSYLIGYPDLSLTDLPSLLSQTEAGHPGELTRYRPFNYLFYASEALAWGNDYVLLNVARIVGLCTFSIFLFIGLYQLFPAMVAGALGALCLTSASWKYVWIGFSPQEQYLALLGIPFIWAYVRLYWYSTPSNSGMPVTWAVCLAFAIVLSGTKENMVILAPVLIVLLALSIYRDRHYDYRLIGSGIAILLMSLITVAILIGLKKNGNADYYGNSVAPADRFVKLAHGAIRYPFTLLFPLCVACFVLRARAKRLPISPQSFKAIDIAAQFQFWLLVLSLSQLVFYDGWPSGSRYEFPAQFFVFASLIIPLFIVGQTIKAVRADLWAPYQAGVLIVAVLAASWRGYGDFRTEVASYVERSRSFTSAISTTAAKAKSAPGTQVMVEASSPSDLEAVFAVNRFLVSLGVTNPMFVRYRELSSTIYPETAFSRGLIDMIERISEHGSIETDFGVGILPSPYLVHYQPLSSFSPSAPCISVRIKDASSDNCVPVATVTY